MAQHRGIDPLRHMHSAQVLVYNSPSFAVLTDSEKYDLAFAIGALNALAASATKVLRASPWSQSELLGDSRDIRRPWEQLPAKSRHAGNRNRFERYRALQRTLVHSQAAQNAILSRQWIKAICHALSAGNNSQGDAAVLGRVRKKTLEQTPPTPHRQENERDHEIVAIIDAKRKKIPRPSVLRIAQILAYRQLPSGRSAPGHHAIRKIYGKHRKNVENQGS